MMWLNTLFLAIAVLVFFLVPWPWYYAAPLAVGVLIALGVISGIVRALVIMGNQ
jgi:hypothetical protein